MTISLSPAFHRLLRFSDSYQRSSGATIPNNGIMAFEQPQPFAFRKEERLDTIEDCNNELSDYQKKEIHPIYEDPEESKESGSTVIMQVEDQIKLEENFAALKYDGDQWDANAKYGYGGDLMNSGTSETVFDARNSSVF